jgi:hypothetical protein
MDCMGDEIDAKLGRPFSQEDPWSSHKVITVLDSHISSHIHPVRAVVMYL